eukprot:TRINITY_DN24793_c0_g1_i2.p1 TRINITY_DN24793_c0_g1~~TRINITY_DN24793_c0_g1_i2.p1  ORF type:complete len:447 (+),score=130.59 TRINITY_DN24793_c0_g1_i2:95-1342(+)
MEAPSDGRVQHPGPDAQQQAMSSLSSLSPSLIDQVPRLLQVLEAARQGEGTTVAGARVRLQQLASSFAETTRAIPYAELDSLVKVLLWILAATNGTWSREFRRASHTLYMCLMESRLRDSPQVGAAAALQDHSVLPDHGDLCPPLGLAPGGPSDGGWAVLPARRDRTLRREQLRRRWQEEARGGFPASFSVEETFWLLDPTDEKRFTFLHWFTEYNGMCQVLSKQMIGQLSALLAELAGDGCVVEVGAGSGRLSHFLNMQPELKARVVPTDAFAGDGHMEAYGDGAGLTAPLQADYDEAVRKFSPTVVLSQWMPEGEDWTAAWRRADSVKHYVLLGEADGGQCGSSQLTWGRPREDFAQPPPVWLAGDASAPPHDADGWKRRTDAGVSAWMVGMCDTLDGGPTTQCDVFSRPGLA